MSKFEAFTENAIGIVENHRARRLQPLNELFNRNAQISARTSNVLADKPTQMLETKYDRYEKIAVVFNVFTENSVICGLSRVTALKKSYASPVREGEKRFQFHLATVPTSEVERLTANPHELNDNYRQDFTVRDAVHTFSESEERENIYAFGRENGLSRRNHLTQVRNRIYSLEGLLDNIEWAVEKPYLNPHLVEPVKYESIS